MCWRGGKRFIKKWLGKVDVVLVCFHYVQQVCLVPDWLVCASCNESGLLLKTFKINQCPGVALAFCIGVL